MSQTLPPAVVAVATNLAPAVALASTLAVALAAAAVAAAATDIPAADPSACLPRATVRGDDELHTRHPPSIVMH